MNEPAVSKHEVYRFGDLSLDLGSRRVLRGAAELELPPKAFAMLHLLAANAPRAMTRKELLDTIWSDAIVEEGSLTWNASVLRKALGDEDGRIVQTVRGYGYRLGLPVEREPVERPLLAGDWRAPEVIPAAEDAEVAVSLGSTREPAADAIPRPSPGRTEGEPQPRSTPTRVWWAAAALVVLAIAFVAARQRIPRHPAAASPGSGPGPRPTLAVLPFENLSAQPQNSWIATALAELLANELALGGGATTIPGESVAAVVRDLGVGTGAAGLSRDSVAGLRSRLGFDLLVAGSYLAIGDPLTVRVDLRLQDAATDATRLVWSEQAALAELGRLISHAGLALRRELAGGAVNGADTVVAATTVAPPEAVRLYAEALEARRAFQLTTARDKLAAALAEAPGFVLARAALADLEAELGYVGRALAESRRALAAVGALAAVERLPIEARNLELEGRWPEAAARWREATTLAAGALEPTLALARAESRAGRHDVAIGLLDELAARPPPQGDDPRILLERGWVERNDQRFEAMLATGEAAVARGRRLGSAHVVAEALAVVAWADLTLDRPQTGLAACVEGEALAESIGNQRLRARFASLCGWLELNQGRGDAAEGWFARSLTTAEQSGDLELQASALRSLGAMRADAGRLAEATGLQERSLALAREAGSRESQLHSLVALAHLEIRNAHLERAEQLALEAVSAARAVNISRRIAVALDLYATVRRLRGDAAAALAAAEEALRVAPSITPGRDAVIALGLARAALAAGQPERAIEALAAVEHSHAAARPPRDPPLAAGLLAARAEASLGRAEAARSRLAAVERRLAEPATTPTTAETLLDLGETQATLGNEAAAAAVWHRILAEDVHAEESRARLEARFRLAEMGARRRPGARESEELAAATTAVATARLGVLLGRPL